MALSALAPSGVTATTIDSVQIFIDGKLLGTATLHVTQTRSVRKEGREGARKEGRERGSKQGRE